MLGHRKAEDRHGESAMGPTMTGRGQTGLPSQLTSLRHWLLKTISGILSCMSTGSSSVIGQFQLLAVFPLGCARSRGVVLLWCATVYSLLLNVHPEQRFSAGSPAFSLLSLLETALTQRATASYFICASAWSCSERVCGASSVLACTLPLSPFKHRDWSLHHLHETLRMSASNGACKKCGVVPYLERFNALLPPRSPQTLRKPVINWLHDIPIRFNRLLRDARGFMTTYLETA